MIADFCLLGLAVCTGYCLGVTVRVSRGNPGFRGVGFGDRVAEGLGGRAHGL